MLKIYKFIVCLLFILILCGCVESDSVEVRDVSEVNYSSTEESFGEEPVGIFIEIERGITYKIVYHSDTKVMYVVKGAFTMLVNEDGTPMIYKGE